MNKFSIEEQYQFYLKLVKLDEATMHTIQKTQLKQTFYMACGQMLMMMREDLSKLTEEEAVNILNDMWDQVYQFVTTINKN